MLKKILFWPLVILIPLGLFVWWNWFVDVPLKISPETSLIMSPLTPDGKRVDYPAWLSTLYPEDFRSERNAGWRILKEIDLRKLTIYDDKNLKPFSRESWSELCTRMDLDPDAPRLSCTSFNANTIEEYAKIKKTDDQNFLSEIMHDWFDSDFRWNDFITKYEDFMQFWVEENAQALDRVEEIVLDPKSEYVFFPLRELYPNAPLYNWVNPVSDGMFALTTSLRAYARWNFFQGNTEKGILCAEAANRLGVLTRKVSLGLENNFTGSMIQNSLVKILFAEAKTPLTAEQWKRISELPLYEYSPEEYLQLMKNFQFKFNMCGVQYLADRATRHENWPFILEDAEGVLFFNQGYDWNQIAREILQSQKEVEENFLKDPWNGTLILSTTIKDEPTSEWQIWRRSHSICRKTRSRALVQDLLYFFSQRMNTIEKLNLTQMDHTHLFRLFCAFQLYRLDHDGQLPPVFTTDAEGKPLHSWTVQLLPYLGKEAEDLYAKIRLDEPWDSEWNAQFHKQMPRVFASSREPGSQENTSFCRVIPETDECDSILFQNYEAKNWMDPSACMAEKDMQELREEDILTILMKNGVLEGEKIF